MSGEERPVASPSQTVGPFFHFGLATNEALGRIATGAEQGEHIRLRIRVLDGDGVPVADALVEVYQADSNGDYRRSPQRPGERPAFTGFGRLPTDPDGVCVFETIRPGPVALGTGGAQAPHVNVCLLARGLLRQVYTRIYFAGDSGHDGDPILGLVPQDRRATLIASRAPEAADTWELVIRLQGERETVFFDI